MNSITPPVAHPATRSLPRWRRAAWGNRRTRTIWTIAACLLFFAIVLIGGQVIGNAGLRATLLSRNQAPSLRHPFGTDWLGRDMLTRTLQGLSLSLFVGLLAASISAVLAVALGVLAGTLGGVVDLVITWITDVFFALPHLVLLILIAFVVGGGVRGVILAVALTHWPGLTRLIRGEVLQLRSTEYVQLAAKFGHGPGWIARRHMLPHLVPQFLVGLILLFPHAILHEAGLTFIGIGLSPHTPAIGVLLAESLRQLSTGYWWLGVLPGVALLVAVKAFDILGDNVRALIDPRTSQE